MIHSFKILNYKGIEHMEIAFTQKNVSIKNLISDQVIQSENGQYYMLTPTFIAKNASGKSSFVKALNYISKFADFNELKRIIESYFKNTLKKHLSDSMLNRAFENVNILLSDEENIKLQLATEFIYEIFKENAHVGKDVIFVEVVTSNNQRISFSSSPVDFVITVDKTKISFKAIFNKLLSKIDLKTLPKILNAKNIEAFEEKLHSMIEKALAKFEYKKVLNLQTIVRNEMVRVNKVKVQQNMVQISRAFGFKGLKTLLTKIDPNVTNVEFDPENETMSIFFRGNNDFPFSPESNLSFGTKKTLEIIAKASEVFSTGGALIIDEIETGLHISLVKLVVSLFNNPNINKAKAQLITTTHTPLIFEKAIVCPKNAFIKQGEEFIHLKSTNAVTRTEDIELSIRAKNYFSDEFWEKANTSPMSTINESTIQSLLDSLLSSNNNNNNEQGEN